jgi:hypothetical protein
MSSIERVMKKHGKTLQRESVPYRDRRRHLTPGMKLEYVGTVLEGQSYVISVIHEFKTEGGHPVHVSGEDIDIDMLADRFPDCRVGY